jgi:hypothetical protein
MKYMLLMNDAPVSDVPADGDWAPEDMRASGEAMMAIHQELTARGELVGAEGLTGREAATGLSRSRRSSLRATGSSTSSRRSGRSRSPQEPPRHLAPAAGRPRGRSRYGL